MSGFTIDDVRETFTADASDLIARLQAAAEAVLANPALEGMGPMGRSPFELVAEMSHALTGTTSLVGARSLSESARLLEETSKAGQEALRQMEASAARARALAGVCLEGAEHMRQMLELELAKKPDEALVLAQVWRQGAVAASATEGPAAAAASPPPADPQEFTFEGAPGASAPETAITPASADAAGGFDFGEAAGEATVSPEVVEVFQEEARAMLPDLEDGLYALRREPRDSLAAGELERLYHTLKGAAATVGMRAVSERAGQLQARLETVLEGGEGASPELVEQTIADTNALLALAQLPELALPDATPSEVSPALLEARPLFIEEARGLHEEAARALADLTASSGGDAEEARVDLYRLFHRLKGSALIVGENELAAAAEQAQHALENTGDEEGTPAGSQSGSRPTELAAQALAVLRAFLQRSGVSLGGEPAPAPAAPAATPTVIRQPVQVETKGELWEAMQLECNELLEQIEREGLALEDSGQPKTHLQALMHHFHTLKGVANTIGLHPTGELVHAIEDFLEKLQEAPILPPMRKVASLMLDAREAVRRNIQQAPEGSVEAQGPRFVARIARLLGPRLGAGPSTMQVSALEEGASIHSLADARSRRSLRHDSVRAVSAGSSPDDGRSDAHAGAIDRKFIRVATERLDNLMNLAGELVVSRSRLLSRAATLRQIQRELGWGSRRLLDSVDTFREEYEFSNLDGRGGRQRLARPQAAAQPRAAGARGQTWTGFGELELDRYDEIHVLSRTLTEITSDFAEMNGQLERGLAALTDDSDSFDKLIAGIQSEVTRARMVTVEVLFTRLKLPVRDAATRDGKEVRVATQGVDVALDKAIADALFQPMLHLVRNSVVHGIERGGPREAAGKPRAGTITLIARQHAGQVAIEVRDDGGGLDLPALHARGVALGLIGADMPLSDPAVRELVFHPGLTTRAQAGAVSGRGVGCDVVRRAVERLGGSIRVESEPGKGAAFLITLPVSLAIAKALLVKAGGRAYAVPLHFAERLIDATDATFVESAGVRRVKVAEELLPVSSLDRHLRPTGGAHSGLRPGAPGRAVLLLRVGDHRLALEVDEVTGQEEVVVKNLGPFLSGHELFAGVTIRGSGELVLILDVAGFIQAAHQPGAQRTRLLQQSIQPQQGMRPTAVGPRALDRAGARKAPRAPEPEAVPAAAPARPAAAPEARLRVLFIDDSLSVRKFAEMTLKTLGVDVTLAVDGVDGMNKLRTQSFDLVFTDLEMPRMHGFELISELRFLPAYKDLPVVVVTSRSGQKHQQQARALGATDYLTKPFSAPMLEGAIKRWARRTGDSPRETPPQSTREKDIS